MVVEVQASAVQASAVQATVEGVQASQVVERERLVLREALRQGIVVEEPGFRAVRAVRGLVVLDMVRRRLLLIARKATATWSSSAQTML